jgi:hypothetical protein
MTLDLVPESAVVVEAHASGDEFEYPFDAGPPFASADITSPLPPKELADQLDVVARGRGWDLLPVEYWPNAIRRPLRSLFYEARVSTRLLPQDSGATAVDISVRRHEWTGPAIVAATSLLIAAVGGFLSERRRRDKTPQHLPWSLWLSTIFVAAIWVAALSFVR